MSEQKIAGVIDIEPTWNAILNMVNERVLAPEYLRPIAKLADQVRQAEKDNKFFIRSSNGETILVDKIEEALNHKWNEVRE